MDIDELKKWLDKQIDVSNEEIEKRRQSTERYAVFEYARWIGHGEAFDAVKNYLINEADYEAE
jgi:hypothetical protein